MDRNEQKLDSGINILKNDKRIATIKCKKIIEDNLQGVDLPLLEY